jgi:AcrR family transcriptional regulator
MKTIRTNAQERILEAAVELFASQGFRGTGTRDIARRAEVTDTSLFRHFPHKEDLFWAAVESRLKRVEIRPELQAGLAQGAEPAVVVPLIVELMVQVASCHPQLVRLLNVGYLELRPRMEPIYHQYLAPLFTAIAKYLAGHSGDAANSALRNKDPYITTAAVAATILAHSGVYQLVTGNPTPYASMPEAIQAYSAYFLDSLLPEGARYGATAGKTTQVIG